LGVSGSSRLRRGLAAPKHLSFFFFFFFFFGTQKAKTWLYAGTVLVLIRLGLVPKFFQEYRLKK
jgi:hypothetical protein